MTDLLGICTSWANGHCVVQPESGDPVEIAWSDIVSGKPVPPRPSMLHRTSAREVELHFHPLWPGLETVVDGDWILRSAPAYAGRLRRRSNSTLALGEPSDSVAAAADRSIAFHQARDRQPMMVVEPGSSQEQALVELGWRDLGDGASRCLVGSVSRLLRAAPATADVEEVEDGPHVEVRLGEFAQGRGTVDGDWVVLHTIEVDPAHRRQGLGSAVMSGLLEWAAARGALHAALHVEVDNAPALALYDRLGWTSHHELRYVVPAD